MRQDCCRNFRLNRVAEIAVKIQFNIGNSNPNSSPIRIGEVSGYRSDLLCTEGIGLGAN